MSTILTEVVTCVKREGSRSSGDRRIWGYSSAVDLAGSRQATVGGPGECGPSDHFPNTTGSAPTLVAGRVWSYHTYTCDGEDNLMNDESTANSESDVNKSILKAASLLRSLAAQPRTGANASVLARATRLSRPTAIRLLFTLEQAGLVDRFGNNYVLGWDLARMGRLADPYTGLAERTQPILQKLAETVNEMATLQVVNTRDGLDLIAEAVGSHLVNIRSQLAEGHTGAEWPLHASAAGKVLLAHMPREKVLSLLPATLPSYASRTITDRDVLLQELARIRKQDYGLVDNELEEEHAAVARPVYDGSGALVAVLTISGPRYRFGLAQVQEALEHMDETRKLLVATCWPDSVAS